MLKRSNARPKEDALSNYWLALLSIGFVAATLTYLLAWRIHLMALVDVVWTAGLGIAAIGYLAHMAEPTLRSYVVLAVLLSLVWATLDVSHPQPCAERQRRPALRLPDCALGSARAAQLLSAISVTGTACHLIHVSHQYRHDSHRCSVGTVRLAWHRDRLVRSCW